MYIIGPLLAASVRRSEVLRARVRGGGVPHVVQEPERGDAGPAAVRQVPGQDARPQQGQVARPQDQVGAHAHTDDAPRRPAAAAAIINRAAPGRTRSTL